MELVNALYVYKEAQKNYNAGLVYETVSALLRLLAPFVPHVTEELWHGVIDADSSVHAQSWPKAEAEAMKVDNVEIVLQVNGKVKGRLVVPAEAGREELEKLAVVLGTEGEGLAADTISNCDYTVRIPMSHGVDSLNVAAASAVAFWQLGRQ